ncbi:glycosyltransferase [Phycicoccus sp. SLBN-51]|uniref:glycosyltransferase n=1 Tax=Phycicoccus sp. SLBN-51 TaxID=2768447 RepID=UPI0011730476|nr:glycosyltransferase involved in cell wall biosynthesis [Phycicoccus sp. SLBN-51]
MNRLSPRVVFVVSHLTPTLGLERVVLNLLDHLSRDLDLRVIVIGGTAADADLAPCPVEVLGAPLRGMARLATPLRLFRVRRNLRRACVVYVGAWAAVPGLLVAPKSSRRIVWEHSLISENVRRTRSLRLLKTAARLVYRRASRIIAVSNPLRDDLRQVGLPAITVPNPLQYPLPVQALEPEGREAFRLCAVGSLTSVKNQALLVRALSQLPSAYTLDLVGDGPKRQALIVLCKELGLGQRVRFHGHQSHAATLEIMAKSAVLLHAATGETFGLVFAEAALLGVPVVAVRNRLSEEWVETGRVRGVTVRAEPSDIAGAVTRLETLPGPASKLDEVTWLKEYRLDAVAARWRSELAAWSEDGGK